MVPLKHNLVSVSQSKGVKINLYFECGCVWQLAITSSYSHFYVVRCFIILQNIHF